MLSSGGETGTIDDSMSTCGLFKTAPPFPALALAVSALSGMRVTVPSWTRCFLFSVFCCFSCTSAIIAITNAAIAINAKMKKHQAGTCIFSSHKMFVFFCFLFRFFEWNPYQSQPSIFFVIVRHIS